MKYIFAFAGGSLLFAACSDPSGGTTISHQESTTLPKDTAHIVANWPGYYTDTLPCADCQGIKTSLWVRADSTFVLQQLYLDRDTVPWGTIGQWHVVNGLLTVGYKGDKPEFYRYTAEGLLTVDEMGQAFESKADYSLDKLADEIGDAIPRMRVMGTFTYAADAQSFQPCGSKFNWPCVGGMDTGEEEGEALLKFSNEDLQRAYRKAVKQGGDPWVVEVIGTMGMGPAMEGDGADEYVYIEAVKRTLGSCP
ncbi:MAG: copper resistance protein NlpE N-terminal domain-containing protein [Flavobacteriales bacterium]|nr:copper resistance protein NlpE N-terminal domain-containing protein [Flavobacteriales bacterium]